MNNEVCGWLGTFEVQRIYSDGSVKVDKFPNLITNNALNLIRDAWNGDNTDLQIKYVALGMDDGTILPLNASNTALGNEQFRKVFTKKTITGTGRLESVVNIGSGEANFNIREIGIYGSLSATNEIGSGILFARVFYSLDKTELDSVNIVRTDTIGRG